MSLYQKSIITLLVAFTVGSAHAAPDSVRGLLGNLRDTWEYNDSTKQWKAQKSTTCNQWLPDLKTAGVADTLEVELDFDTPFLKKGKHPVSAIKELCQHAIRTARIFDLVQFMGYGATSGETRLAVDCLERYDWALAVGHTPTTTLPYEGISMKDPATGNEFAGTIEDARKRFCDPLAKPVLDAAAAAEAPYRKHLKTDKLKLALKYRGKQFYGPGKRSLDKPEQLASNKIWFREYFYEDQSCDVRNSQKKTFMVVRYSFDAKHTMLGETSKSFCGAPAKSAFK